MAQCHKRAFVTPPNVNCADISATGTMVGLILVVSGLNLRIDQVEETLKSLTLQGMDLITGEVRPEPASGLAPEQGQDILHPDPVEGIGIGEPPALLLGPRRQSLTATCGPTARSSRPRLPAVCYVFPCIPLCSRA